MPMYDRRCSGCGREAIDLFEPISKPDYTDNCCPEGIMQRAWIGGVGSKVIGDEIDVIIRHGLCNADGSPRRFRSRIEMNKVAKEKDLVNRVEHIGAKGSDKSKATTKWY